MISVCMASHNGERYIRLQIESILAQLSDTDELIISDDGSIDTTIHIIESFGDHRIRLLHFFLGKDLNPKYSATHYKVTSNFENALVHAEGDFIFLADQDDIWMPNKIAIMLPLLYKYKFVRSNNSIIDGEGNTVFNKEYNHNPMTLGNMWHFPFRGCCCAFQREVLEIALPFPKHCIMHDTWIGLVAFFMCRSVFFVDQSLIAYRRYDKNVSSEKGRSANPYWFRVTYRLQIAFQLLKRAIKKRGCFVS